MELAMPNTPKIGAADQANIKNAQTPSALQEAIKKAATDMGASNPKANVGELKNAVDKLLSKDDKDREAADEFLGKSNSKTALSANPFG
jgi:hypothetical protein